MGKIRTFAGKIFRLHGNTSAALPGMSPQMLTFALPILQYAMIVCIAEKPSVAKDIARILGANAAKNGYMEGNGYQVTWTFGHLCTLKEPHDYTPLWKAWSLGGLPMIPAQFGIKLIDDDGIKKQFRVIESLMREADEIVNCGDAGQEGELIQRWVMLKAGARCPVKRLWISSLTEESIREGFRQLKDQAEYQSLYEAGLARAIGDWLLGINATRLYTLKYGMRGQVLSIGRVQTPTLALIVNRQKEIRDFVPEQYWELKTRYRDVAFSSEYGRFASKEEGESALEKVRGKAFTVADIAKKRGVEYPPRLFDLTSLQVECNKKFGMSADETLRTIQSLYEKKATTYPRVDTAFLSEDIYPKCPAILKGLKGYETLVAPLDGKKLPKTKRVFDNSKVTDHHAIIPTGAPVRNLTDEEKRVFDLVARRFIAAFYPECRFTTTAVTGMVDGIRFKATGKQITDAGWRVVLGNKEAKENDAEEEGILPDFVKGESGPHEPFLGEKWTQPPKYYTEATLLRAMETAGKFVEDNDLRDALKENGIGRPSTRAAIIETLLKRHYIRKEKKNLVATSTGEDLIGLIHEELLKSAELTGIWEKKLREIERKEYSTRTFIDELKTMVTGIVHTVLSDNTNRHVSVEVQKKEAPKAAKKKPAKRQKPPQEAKGAVVAGAVCPLCGKGTVIKGRTAYGCSEWKNGCTFRQPFDEK